MPETVQGALTLITSNRRMVERLKAAWGTSDDHNKNPGWRSAAELRGGAAGESRARTMGKADKNQDKLQFDRRKSNSPAGDRAELGLTGGTGVSSGEEQDLRQILVAMQHSLTQDRW
ncbi:hypothetical protein NDU88_000147 [Pleurodeles waltl]|uniref:Uncharacterized protein n=1 Tax=Pleurodeles waltl TaxID=8319 RepID=A0AAV7UPP5_PLEWA|nr:hypothetical protein NDU88_000147 [Pleurodeles waltl]